MQDMPDCYLTEPIDDRDWRSLAFRKSPQDYALVIPAVRAVSAVHTNNPNWTSCIDITIADCGTKTIFFDNAEQAKEFRNRLLVKIEKYYERGCAG